MPNYFAPTKLDEALHLICEQMQITETQRTQAETRYHGVAQYIARPGGPLERAGVDIYPQGSLRIGTTIKPLNREDYDLDLVCHLDIPATAWGQPETLLGILWDDLSANGNYAGLLERMTRCIRLDYANEFHMDILPGCQDIATCPTCIQIPDAEDRAWTPSNPIGFADWFLDQAERNATLIENVNRASLVEALVARADIAPLPPQDPRFAPVPLKRAVQLMKRNRDIVFSRDPKLKPISVVLTTLAGKHYLGKTSISDSIVDILTRTLEQIQIQEDYGNSRLVVRNPKNEAEDFSEKWDEYPERYESFKNWAWNFRDSMSGIVAKAQTHGVIAVESELQALFGEGIVANAIGKWREIHPEVPAMALPAVAVGLPATLKKYFPRLFRMAEHREAPEAKWKIAPTGYVSITALFKGDGFRPEYSSDGPPLPKRRKITFSAHTNVKEPYAVYWQVVNTGDEARIDNGLRGTIIPGDGLRRTEDTLYKGKHWVQCFIVKDGQCHAQSDPFFVNIS